MRLLIATLLATFAFTACAAGQEGPIIAQDVVSIAGEAVSLADYRGQVLLIVNTASECGYTPQLAGLQELQQTYGDRGFTVLGFPCNDFGGQSPGSSGEIAAFCSDEYGVSFPLFERISITGDDPHPLYDALQNETGSGISGAVRWNFTKFLVDAEGHVIDRFEPAAAPLSDEVTGAIEAALN